MNDHLDYTPQEITRNRFWNRTLLIGCIGGVWVAWYLKVVSVSGAVVLTIGLLFFSWLYRVLFASPTSVKLDENSAGSGKRVRPGTMGAILGVLYDGFKR